MPSYLVTGSSRGLGLEFVTELLNEPSNKVIATARNTAASKGLQDLRSKHAEDRLVLLDLDVTKDNSIKTAVSELTRILPSGLDNFVSNAGLSHQPLATFEELDLDALDDEMRFNTSAMVLLLRSFLPLIRKGQGKKIMVLTTRLASIEVGFHLPDLANVYSTGKAALNMLIRKWSAVLKQEGITTILMYPGWIKETGLGDGIRPWIEKNLPEFPNITEHEAVTGCLKVMKGATLEESGVFYDYEGNKVPW